MRDNISTNDFASNMKMLQVLINHRWIYAQQTIFFCSNFNQNWSIKLLQNYPPIDVRLIIEKARELSSSTWSRCQSSTCCIIIKRRVKSVANKHSALVECLRYIRLLTFLLNSVILKSRRRPCHKYWVLTRKSWQLRKILFWRYARCQQFIMLSFVIESSMSIPWHISNVIFVSNHIWIQCLAGMYLHYVSC